MSTLADRPTVAPTLAAPSSSRRAGWGIALWAASLIEFISLQYAMPANFTTVMKLGQESVSLWTVGRHLPTLPMPAFVAVFQGCVAALWLSYALMLRAAWRGALPTPKAICYIIVAASVSMAILCPPSLSMDLFAYVGYARMELLYGLNPYTHSAAALALCHDPIAPYLRWDLPSVYGPLWTRLSFALVGPLLSAGLWAQLVALKLLEAAALIIAAFAGRGIAERFAPGRGNLTLLAIGLNPLFLIEGPGSGHNDLLMMCLLLVGALLLFQKKYLLAGLLVGLALGIKLVPLLAAPWIIAEAVKDKPGRHKLLYALALGALVLLPTLLCYGSLWQGGATLGALHHRAAFGSDALQVQEDAQRATSLASYGLPLAAAQLLVTMGHQWLLLTLYAALSFWLWRRFAFGNWLTAWAILSGGVMFLSMGIALPWYLCWVWMPALTRWNRVSLALSAACFIIGLLWECFYPTPFTYLI